MRRRGAPEDLAGPRGHIPTPLMMLPKGATTLLRTPSSNLPTSTQVLSLVRITAGPRAQVRKNDVKRRGPQLSSSPVVG